MTAFHVALLVTFAAAAYLLGYWHGAKMATKVCCDQISKAVV